MKDIINSCYEHGLTFSLLLIGKAEDFRMMGIPADRVHYSDTTGSIRIQFDSEYHSMSISNTDDQKMVCHVGFDELTTLIIPWTFVAGVNITGNPTHKWPKDETPPSSVPAHVAVDLPQLTFGDLVENIFPISRHPKYRWNDKPMYNFPPPPTPTTPLCA